MSRHLLIDAMNVIGSRADKWWNDPERAMRAMAAAVDDYGASTSEEITLVFDKDPGSLPAAKHVSVVVARRRGRNAADHEIEQIVAGADDPSSFTVVTSDKKLAERVRSLGARVTGAGSFRRRLDEAET